MAFVYKIPGNNIKILFHTQRVNIERGPARREDQGASVLDDNMSGTQQQVVDLKRGLADPKPLTGTNKYI